ncbi:MAG: glucosaminidase domain-containing protein [Bacteroidaceae bacterium]|nr:glucosaminidase domain-containing protein [Bacteroidaceae bacterium]
MNCNIKKYLWLSFLLSVAVPSLYAQVRKDAYQRYVEKYAPIARQQMEEYKIPASITLAQALLESGAGKSKLAQISNNHFGIKCGSNWSGKRVKYDDDRRNECFRSYKKVLESYQDHANFLSSKDRYAALFKLDVTDYKGWAHGLKRAGYATSSTYAKRLIAIIEKYKLYKYDKDVSPAQEMVQTHAFLLCNNLVFIRAKAGDTLDTLAEELGISVSKICRYNEFSSNYQLSAGEVVFLHKKKRKAAKGCKEHVIRVNESMHSIAQLYGIRLSSLYFMNNKEMDYTPEVGEVLLLR